MGAVAADVVLVIGAAAGLAYLFYMIGRHSRKSEVDTLTRENQGLRTRTPDHHLKQAEEAREVARHAEEELRRIQEELRMAKGAHTKAWKKSRDAKEELEERDEQIAALAEEAERLRAAVTDSSLSADRMAEISMSAASKESRDAKEELERRDERIVALEEEAERWRTIVAEASSTADHLTELSTSAVDRLAQGDTLYDNMLQKALPWLALEGGRFSGLVPTDAAPQILVEAGHRYVLGHLGREGTNARVAVDFESDRSPAFWDAFVRAAEELRQEGHGGDLTVMNESRAELLVPTSHLSYWRLHFIRRIIRTAAAHEKWCPLCRTHPQVDRIVVLRGTAGDAAGAEGAREGEPVHEIECARCGLRYYVTSTLHSSMREQPPGGLVVALTEELKDLVPRTPAVGTRENPLSMQHLEELR